MGNTLSILTNKTFVGYATLLVVIGFVGYTQHNANRAKQQKIASQKHRAQDAREQPKKENKAKRQRMESFASESSKQPQPKAQPKSFAAATQSKAKDYSSDDGVDNREFAKQMAQNKKNKFAPRVNNEQKQKSVKQSKAKDISHETPADNGKASAPSAPSAPSSTAGIDGDDDQSSAASPIVSASDPTGISDMLEQPTSGPSVLRLTDTAEKQQKPKQAKSPQPTETKKQRQNRLKVERAKAQREEDEKARKALMEAQRRTAREAEGRAAKDGSTFTAAQKSSAWTGNQVNGKSGQAAAPTTVQPLDTFDNNPKASVATPSVPAQKKENVKQNGGKTSWADIPYSEEEQLEMLKKESEEWVPVAKSRKKKTKNANAVSETDESATEAHAAQAGNKAAPRANDINGRPKVQTLPSQSSFAALSDDGANLAEEQEQEWDV